MIDSGSYILLTSQILPLGAELKAHPILSSIACCSLEKIWQFFPTGVALYGQVQNLL